MVIWMLMFPVLPGASVTLPVGASTSATETSTLLANDAPAIAKTMPTSAAVIAVQRRRLLFVPVGVSTLPYSLCREIRRAGRIGLSTTKNRAPARTAVLPSVLELGTTAPPERTCLPNRTSPPAVRAASRGLDAKRPSRRRCLTPSVEIVRVTRGNQGKRRPAPRFVILPSHRPSYPSCLVAAMSRPRRGALPPDFEDCAIPTG